MMTDIEKINAVLREHHDQQPDTYGMVPHAMLVGGEIVMVGTWYEPQDVLTMYNMEPKRYGAKEEEDERSSLDSLAPRTAPEAS